MSISMSMFEMRMMTWSMSNIMSRFLMLIMRYKLRLYILNKCHRPWGMFSSGGDDHKDVHHSGGDDHRGTHNEEGGKVVVQSQKHEMVPQTIIDGLNVVRIPSGDEMTIDERLHVDHRAEKIVVDKEHE
ncbi:unnamed protein product [Citrullus colocynthis]|uniref:DUF2382 domain-containing protein n=1 Tax=Citrullus colocynthis TaxID=252529 RepID=A0ABP0YZG7_9ROSI